MSKCRRCRVRRLRARDTCVCRDSSVVRCVNFAADDSWAGRSEPSRAIRFNYPYANDHKTIKFVTKTAHTAQNERTRHTIDTCGCACLSSHATAPGRHCLESVPRCSCLRLRRRETHARTPACIRISVQRVEQPKRMLRAPIRSADPAGAMWTCDHRRRGGGRVVVIAYDDRLYPNHLGRHTSIALGRAAMQRAATRGDRRRCRRRYCSLRSVRSSVRAQSRGAIRARRADRRSRLAAPEPSHPCL